MNVSTHFPAQHLALVLQNGSVWDISFSDNYISLERRLLIQLPKSSRPFHAFLTDWETLTFVKNDLSMNIIQFNKNSRPHHSKIPGSTVTFNKVQFPLCSIFHHSTHKKSSRNTFNK